MKRLIEWVPTHGFMVPVRKAPRDCERTIGRIGLLFNHRALWVGVHHSARDKRTCINLLPCLTLWYTRPGGVLP